MNNLERDSKQDDVLVMEMSTQEFSSLTDADINFFEKGIAIFSNQELEKPSCP